MNNFGRLLVGLTTCAALLSSGIAMAAPPLPATSLNTCQDKVRTEGKMFVQNTIAAVGTCLKAVATDVIKKNVAITAATSKTCVKQFRTINDTRGLGKSLQEKLRKNIFNKCDPAAGANVTHSVADVTGVAPLLPQPIDAANLDTWCKHFGGDGSIDSVAEWEDCMVGSFDCEVAAAIWAQYPRALEWLTTLTAVGTNMNLVVPPAADPSRTTDAVAGANSFKTLIDPDGDGIPNPTCGGEGVACATACCYVEVPPIPPIAPPGDVTCFQYTAPAAQIAGFMGMCGGPSLGGFMIKTPVLAPCFAAPAPMTGLPCFVAPALVKIPSDATCP
jgi:hypothetical protein